VKSSVSTLSVLAIGDSITNGGYGQSVDGQAWRSKFVELSAVAGTTVDMKTMAVGGWGVGDVAPQMASVLVSYKPDLIIFVLGTNDSSGGPSGAAAFITTYKKIIVNALDMTPASTRIAISFLPHFISPAPYNVINNQSYQDGIFQTLYNFGWTYSLPDPKPRYAGSPSLDQIPSSGFVGDGIHLNAYGNAVMGTVVYNTVASRYDWNTVALP
jgi:lysophospholipase L1-like esterase